MKLSDNTKRAIKNYGEQKCKDAFAMSSKGKGSGSKTIGKVLELSALQVIAAIKAGHEIAQQADALASAPVEQETPPVEAVKPYVANLTRPKAPKAVKARQPQPMADSPLFVTMTDGFASSFKDKTFKFVIQCDDANTANKVLQAAQRSDHMSAIAVVREKPVYSDDTHITEHKHINQLGSRWTAE